MSDQEVILRALRQVRRRLRLSRALHAAATALGMLAVALLLWRVLQIFAGRAPAIVAAATLFALLLWAACLFLLVRRRLAVRCTLSTAATSVDARAGLKDELTTAHWFLDHPMRSPWIEAQAARAAQSVRHLNLASLLPLRMDWRELTGGAGAALLLFATWLVPPLAPASGAAPRGHELPSAQAQQVQLIRDAIGQTQGEAVAENLEKAIATFERQTPSTQEKQRALSAAEQAIEQQGLEAASTREGLYRLAAKLRSNQRLEAVARALEEGDVQGAARLMERMAERDNSVVSQAGGSLVPHDEQRNLERLFATASSEDHRGYPQSSSAAAQEAANRLSSIAQQLREQGRWKQAAQALHQLQQAVAQGENSAGLPQRDAHDIATRSENSGTGMPSTMGREAALTQPSHEASAGEGGRPALAGGEAKNNAVLDIKTAPLQVQLQKEAIGAEQLEPGAAKNWFYAGTRQRESGVGFENVSVRSEFTLGQSEAVDGVAVRHRQIVKDYFTVSNQSTHP
jgi:hypothetical protein